MTPVLVMLSGGPDSAAGAWIVAQRQPAVLCHARISVRAWARKAEARAARAVARWIAANAPHPVRYIETGAWLPREVAIARGDMLRLAAPRAAMLAGFPDVRQAATCAVDEDYADGWSGRFDAYSASVEAALQGVAEPPEWTAPLGWPPPPKADVLDAMPAELKALCTSCRNPDREGRPCGSCGKCLGDVRGVRLPRLRIAGRRSMDWDRIVLVEAGLPGRLAGGERVLALAPHPERGALAALRRQAVQAVGGGIEIDVVPLWLPPLDRVFARDPPSWKRARKVACRVLAELWRHACTS